VKNACRLAILFIDEDQVDVRRRVQFPPAELAHPDDAERQPFAVGPARLAEERLQIRREHRERALDRDFREVGHRAGHFGNVGEAREIAFHHRAENFGTQAPQRGLERGLVERAVTGAARAKRVQARFDPAARDA
jgi:hypothetical protein